MQSCLWVIAPRDRPDQHARSGRNRYMVDWSGLQVLTGMRSEEPKIATWLRAVTLC